MKNKHITAIVVCLMTITTFGQSIDEITWLDNTFDDMPFKTVKSGYLYSYSANESSNLILNGGFESDIPGSDSALYWWHSVNDNDNIANWSVVMDPHSGNNALMAIVASRAEDAQSWTIQLVNTSTGMKIPVGKSYTCSIWMKADDSDNMVNISAGLKHEPFTEVGMSYNIHLTADWKQYSFTFYNDLEDSLNFPIHLLTEGTFWFDDLEVVENTFPQPPVLDLPVNGATNQSTTVTLLWHTMDEPESFHLQVDENSYFSSPFIDRQTIYVGTQQVTNLAHNTKYYWRVRAKNAYGFGEWSAVSNFTIIPSEKGVWEGKTDKNRDVYFHVNDQLIIDSLSAKITVNFITYTCTYTFFLYDDIPITNHSFEGTLRNSFIFICKDSDYPKIKGNFSDNSHCIGTISSFKQCGGYCGSTLTISSGSSVHELTWSAGGEIDFNTTALKTESESLFRCFPNPVKNLLHIEGVDEDYTTLTVYAADGRLLKQVSGTGISIIDLSELQDGIYLLTIRNTQKNMTIRIIKQ